MLLLASPMVLPAMDHVRFEREGTERGIAGKLLVKAEDGGLLLVTPDGEFWTVTPEELVSHTTDDEPFTALDADRAAEKLLAGLPEGFRAHITQNYVILYNTSQAYAQWCGGMFERLHRAFMNYWTRRGFRIEQPQFPLVALVFADQGSYAAYAKRELGEATGSIIGYYSLASNRITTYDLTGIESLRRPGDRRGSPQDIAAMLSRPEAQRSVATVVHEATHQLAFNSGLQTRYADVPLWVSEGIAVYFETPDLKSSRGWASLGEVNQARLNDFRNYLRNRPADSLVTLMADDHRFRDPKRAQEAYAEAWALNYFLLRQRRKEYHAYLRMLAEKPQLVWDTPEVRLAAFREAFGDLAELDAEFLKAMEKL